MHSLLNSLINVSDVELLSSVKSIKSSEDKAVAQIVLHLYEINIRKLYRDAGYPSLFNYCVSALGYSESSAYRRMVAAKALAENPEIYDLLAEGKITLFTVAEIYKTVKPEDKAKVLEAAIGQPKSEVLKLTAQYLAPSTGLKRERLRMKKVVKSSNLEVQASLPLFTQPEEQAEEEFRFAASLEFDQQFMELYEEAKSYVGPVPMVEVLRSGLKAFVDKKRLRAPKAKKVLVPANEEPSQSLAKPTRYIPKATRYQVKARDNHQCSFTSKDGHRCEERVALQFDHIVPFAKGGSNEVSNLRLLCSAHNLLCAEREFGRSNIVQHFRCGSAECENSGDSSGDNSPVSRLQRYSKGWIFNYELFE